MVCGRQSVNNYESYGIYYTRVHEKRLEREARVSQFAGIKLDR